MLLGVEIECMRGPDCLPGATRPGTFAGRCPGRLLDRPILDRLYASCIRNLERVALSTIQIGSLEKLWVGSKNIHQKQMVDIMSRMQEALFSAPSNEACHNQRLKDVSCGLEQTSMMDPQIQSQLPGQVRHQESFEGAIVSRIV